MHLSAISFASAPLHITSLHTLLLTSCFKSILHWPELAGLEQMRSWMRAELFLTNYRPVPLTEHAVFSGCIYAKVTAPAPLPQH